MEASPPSLSDEAKIAKCNFQTVPRVIDGDTFVIADGTKIRLLGVDTPEILDPRKDIQWFGKEASLKLREWIEGETVCLRQDRDKTQDIDKYGRLLRYAWKYTNGKQTSDNAKILEGFFVNAAIIQQGYGFAYTKYPFHYTEDFRKYERVARESNRGLWNNKKQGIWKKELEKNRGLAKTCGKAETICPENAVDHIGEYKTVRFFVKKSYDSGKAVFLNSKNNFEDYDNFTAVLFKDDRNKFPSQPADLYLGKTIDVSGRIKEYKGRAEIILKDSSQIKIVD